MRILQPFALACKKWPISARHSKARLNGARRRPVLPRRRAIRSRHATIGTWPPFTMVPPNGLTMILESSTSSYTRRSGNAFQTMRGWQTTKSKRLRSRSRANQFQPGFTCRPAIAMARCRWWFPFLAWTASKRLEPISKSPEEDNEAGELYEAEEVLGVVFPTDEDAALPLNPSKEALHEPASHIAAQPSPILRGRLASVAAMRRDHLDAVLAQLLIEWIAIVGAIANQILRLGLDHVEVEA